MCLFCVGTSVYEYVGNWQITCSSPGWENYVDEISCHRISDTKLVCRGAGNTPDMFYNINGRTITAQIQDSDTRARKDLADFRGEYNGDGLIHWDGQWKGKPVRFTWMKQGTRTLINLI